MLLGKRPGPPGMRRTTSVSGGMQMTGSNLEPHDEVMPPPPPPPPPPPDHNNTIATLHLHGDDGIKYPPRHDAVPMVGRPDHGLTVTAPADRAMHITFGSKEYQLCDDEPNFLGMVVSTSSHMSANKTTNSPVVVHSTADFLLTCGLCKCRLAPGRDIYMYRGDTAFCSLECREQRMKEDSRKEKRKLLAAASNNKVDHRASWAPPTATATAKASAKSKAAACT